MEAQVWMTGRVGGEVEEGGDRRVREGQHRVVRGSAA